MTTRKRQLGVNYLFYYYPRFLVANPTPGDPFSDASDTSDTSDALKAIELRRKQSTLEIFPFVVVGLIFLCLIIRRRRVELLKQAKLARRSTSRNRFKKF